MDEKGRNLLDEICPVQYIEGINENEAKPGKFTVKEYGMDDLQFIGIKYTPKMSYCLSKLGIFYCATLRTREDIKVEVNLCNAYKNHPSDIVLSGGSFNPKLPKQKTEEYYWQEVDLKPVVVIRDKEYWITIGVEYGNILLPTASEKQCAFRVRKNVKWATPDVANFGIILKFHGRVMPIAL